MAAMLADYEAKGRKVTVCKPAYAKGYRAATRSNAGRKARQHIFKV